MTALHHPHLYKRDRLWYCRSIDGSVTGIGWTFWDAYEDWKIWRSRS